ncbi:sulfotransferase [Oscillatoriales cyanobacterium LEGE 11467]|uniref:Sulfotransferase n=1 Tax=Zarconia navalis LEGE 11467 TaxID=1828826 RepID=A0A928VYD7_9CYAN|nr:sulfotransferase [Zarconia navalis]MBE9040025.1 sulfotransferase [Zarconia navalis LEGE 11467]
MDRNIQGRIFLVGCPRSGTTLLQSLLAAHPQIASFPESHFFTSLEPSKAWIRQLELGLASGKRAKSRFLEFLKILNQEQMQSYLPGFAPFMQQYTAAFVRVLDTLTLEQGKSWWLEKTPGHLQCIDLIEKQVPEAQFLHIVRNGTDVVASIYDVANHHHSEGWLEPGNLDKCIDRWIASMEITQQYAARPHHTVVRYEALVENSQEVLKDLCEAIEIEFDPMMLQGYRAAAKQVVRQDETWKASAEQPIHNANGKKFYKVFDEAQREHILAKLSQVDLDRLCVARAG